MGVAVAVAALVRDPLLFMRTNLVRPNLGGAVFGNDPIWMTLVADKPAALPDGQVIRAWSITLGAADRPDSFKAYWCPYAIDTTRSVTIGPAATLMFTADMTGCSLGVGSRTITGHQLVSHANCAQIGSLIANFYGNDDGAMQLFVLRESQRAFQNLSLRQSHGGDPGMMAIEPASYVQDAREPTQELSSTTFGVKDEHDQWAFYVQKRGFKNHRDELVGVAFVAGVQPVQVARNNGGCVLF
jgi:hypothetical protein